MVSIEDAARTLAQRNQRTQSQPVTHEATVAHEIVIKLKVTFWEILL